MFIIKYNEIYKYKYDNRMSATFLGKNKPKKKSRYKNVNNM